MTIAKPSSKTAAALILALLTVLPAVAVLSLDLSGKLSSLHNMAYDFMFYLKARFTSPPARTDSPVALVCIDDKTFADARFKLPIILWNDYFSTAIQGLANGGAKAIGLDYLLPQVQFDEQKVPGYPRPWLKAFVYAKMKGSRLIVGLIQRTNLQLRPEKTYLQIVGPENLALFNLTPDSDDFIRRQQLFFPAKEAKGQGTYGLAALLALTLAPNLTWPHDPVYIAYDSGPLPFPRYSLVDIYQKSLDGDVNYLQQHFKGKIVIIGETDSGTADRHATPFYYLLEGIHKRIPGVEIHGHTINTLLSRRFLTEIPASARAGLYLAVSIIAGLIIFKTSRHVTLIIGAAGLMLTCLVVSFGAYLQYYVLPLAETMIAAASSMVTCFAYRFWTVDKEKKKTRDAFSRYVNPQVVDAIMANPQMLQLGGTRRVMTVFFSDLAGFTKLSESMPPEDLVRLLNRYLNLMTQAILNRGGTLDKFEGDAIMAFWGAPLNQENHALLACLAALDQMNIMERFLHELSAEGLPKLTVRMGLNTGPMIVGNMGSETRFDYTVMGDAVNLASRLEGANKAYGSTAMISEATYEAVKDKLEVRELDFIRVKGRQQPIRVYELWASTGEISPQKNELRQVYMAGLQAYRNRDFIKALEFFQQALMVDPEDGPSRTYIQRCQAFLDTPPPEDWDRVFTLSTK